MLFLIERIFQSIDEKINSLENQTTATLERLENVLSKMMNKDGNTKHKISDRKKDNLTKSSTKDSQNSRRGSRANPKSKK